MLVLSLRSKEPAEARAKAKAKGKAKASAKPAAAAPPPPPNAPPPPDFKGDEAEREEGDKDLEEKIPVYGKNFAGRAPPNTEPYLLRFQAIQAIWWKILG